MYEILIGGGDISAFTLGSASQNVILKALYVLSTFVLLIHILNMLIAIMGGTYSERSVISHQIKVRDHIAFVRDNWFLIDAVFKDKEKYKYKYVLAAFDASANIE